MSGFNLGERLQPALLDRLIDENRTVTRLKIIVDTDACSRTSTDVASIIAALKRQGLQLVDRYPSEGALHEETLEWLAPGIVTPTAFASLELEQGPPGHLVRLREVSRVEARTEVSPDEAPGMRDGITMQRLYKSVRRDLEWLLNATNCDHSLVPKRHPHIADSVLNFGMPNLSGQSIATLDPDAMAREVRLAISRFEPRLSRVHVTYEPPPAGAGTVGLSFRIEAELWGLPVSQPMLLRTTLDLQNGQFALADQSDS